MTARRPAIERFAEKIALAASGCIEWIGGTNGAGYGSFFVAWSAGQSVKELAHRWSYEYHVGPIPDGLHIDHLCRNTLCVNPQHLEPVSQRENTLRGIGIAPTHAEKTHCDNGHPFAGENLILRANGRWRDCRECKRIKDRRYYDKRKTA